MKTFKTFSLEIVEVLRRGGVGVIPTDTLYGIVVSALDPMAVERVYRLRRRSPDKPVIVLLSSPLELRKFGVRPGAYPQKFIAKYWPGKISIILPCRLKKFAYLHRGTNSLAFRVPKDAKLRAFLRSTGPLIAPSANYEGEPPAKTIRAAQKYFGDEVDFYLDAGKQESKPSTLVRFDKNKIVVVREGAVVVAPHSF